MQKQNYYLTKDPHLPLNKLKQPLIDELAQMDIKHSNPIINEILMAVLVILKAEKTMFKAKKELSDPGFV